MSFFSSILGSFHKGSNAPDLTQSAQPEQVKEPNLVAEFGESLETNNPLKVSFARAMSHLQRSQGARQGDKVDQKRDPSNLPITRHRAQFALKMKQLEKAVTRITLLECVERGMTVFKLPLQKAYEKENEKLLKKVCPGIFVAESKEEQLTLLRDALESHNSHLNGLFHQIVRWTLLQPKRAHLTQEQAFEMITEVLARLKSKFKTNDPTIPFLKIAIQERAKWYLQATNQNSFDQLFDFMKQENELIFNEIPEMYYNSFVGADHPKVQENLRNKNDLVKILDLDIKERIVQLQLQAIAEVLAPSRDEIGICSQVLQNHFMNEDLGVRETQLLHTMMKNWGAQVTGQLQVLPLEYFITHHPSHLDPESQLAQDLQEYKSLEQRASLLKQDAPNHERQWLERTARIVQEKQRAVEKIEKSCRKDLERTKELKNKIGKYPPNLQELTTSLKAQILILESKIRSAKTENERKSYADSLTRVQTVFDVQMKLLVNLGIDQASLRLCKAEQAQLELQRAKKELTDGQCQFRQTLTNQLQRIKSEQDRLLERDYRFSKKDFKQMMKGSHEPVELQ